MLKNFKQTQSTKKKAYDQLLIEQKFRIYLKNLFLNWEHHNDYMSEQRYELSGKIINKVDPRVN